MTARVPAWEDRRHRERLRLMRTSPAFRAAWLARYREPLRGLVAEHADREFGVLPGLLTDTDDGRVAA